MHAPRDNPAAVSAAMPAGAAALPVTVIEPAKGWIPIDFAELWRYRELFGFLVWRDVKVKYKQTLLGFAWAVLVPFTEMVIFSLIFGRLAGLPSDGLPGPIFYFAALLPWTYFATALTMSGNSLVGGAGFLTKIYFPRLIIPTGPCVAGLVDFAIAFVILIGMMLWFGIAPAITTLLLPALLLMAMGTALGAGLILSALNVKYRDIRYVIPFLTQVWMYCTVILPFSKLPVELGPARYLYGLNPMAGVVEGFRWCLAHPHMSVQREGPPALSAADVDMARLTDSLRDGGDPLSAPLRARLTPATRAWLDDPAAGPAGAEALIAELNRIIAGDPIYDAALFPPAALSDETVALLAASRAADRPPSLARRLLLGDRARAAFDDARRQRLNRLLLRDAYPRAIAAIRPVAAPVEAPWRLLAVGAPVTLLLLILGLYYFKRTERMFADIV